MIKVDISFDNTYEEFRNIEEEKIYKKEGSVLLKKTAVFKRFWLKIFVLF